MAVSYVGAAQGSANSATQSCTLPAGISAGDVILVVLSTAYTVTTPPAGFAYLDSQSGNNVTMLLYARIADGSESSTTITAQFDSIGRSQIGAVVLSGVGSSPIGAFALAGHAGAASTAHAMPSITSTATGSVAVAFAVERGTLTAGQTWSGPSGYAERIDSNVGGNGAIGLYIGTRLTATTAGDAMGGGTATGSLSTTNAVTATVEILPAAATVAATMTMTAGTATADGGLADFLAVPVANLADNYDRANLRVHYDNRPFIVGFSALGAAMLNAQPDPNGPNNYVDITQDVQHIQITRGVGVDGVVFTAQSAVCRLTFKDLTYAELLPGARVIVTYTHSDEFDVYQEVLFDGQASIGDGSVEPSYDEPEQVERTVTVTATDIVEKLARSTLPETFSAPMELARDRLVRLLGPQVEFATPPLPSMMAAIPHGSGTVLDAANDAAAAAQVALDFATETLVVPPSRDVSWVLQDQHLRRVGSAVGADTGVTAVQVSLDDESSPQPATVRLPGPRWRNEVEMSIGLDRRTVTPPAPSPAFDVEPSRYAGTLPLAQGGSLQVTSLELGPDAIQDGHYLIRPLEAVDVTADGRQYDGVVLGVAHDIDPREWRISLDAGPAFLLDRTDPRPAPPQSITFALVDDDAFTATWRVSLDDHFSRGGYGTRVQVAAGGGADPPFEAPYLLFDQAADPLGADFNSDVYSAGWTPGTTVHVSVRVLTDDPTLTSEVLTAQVVVGTGPVDPDPPDPVTAVRFGWHVGSGDGGTSPWSAAFNESSTLLGYPRCYRAFRSDGTLPTSWSTWSAPNNSASVLYVVSWKPVYATLMSGGYDSVINTFLTWCHTNQYRTRLATWHEYDVKSMDATQFKAMWTYVAQKVRTFNSPYVKNALINGGFKAASIQATYLPSDLSLIDVFASDPYAAGQATADRTTYSGGRKVVDQYHYNFKDNYLPDTVLSGIAEIGRKTSYGTDAQGAQWWRGAFDRIIEHGNTEFVAMYNHDSENGATLIGSRQPDFAATAAAIKSYVDASPLGF